MRYFVTAVMCLVVCLPAVYSQSRSALETDPSGWVDLLADKSMKNWMRHPLGAAGQLRPGQMTDPSPFKLDPATGVLVVEGDKVGHEWLRWNQELGNAVAHVELRFTRVEGEQPRYNSGVFIRTSEDSKIWHQAQALAAATYIFGSTIVNGALQRINLMDKNAANPLKPIGEWNTYELSAVGRKISLWVNGAVVSEFAECDVPRGYFGVEAEGFHVEFRNIRLKTLP